MKLAAGILTHNPLKHGRKRLLKECIESLQDADELTVFDNGSVDVFEVDADVVKFPILPGSPPGNTCGYGMNKIARRLKDHADIVLLSNDDIIWKPEAISILKEVWTEAQEGLTIISGLLEPTFAVPGKEAWNLPFAGFELAGHQLLSRKSVPGGAWTFRSSDYEHIFPVSTFPGVDDVPACHKLVLEGRAVAAIDLASHEGKESTWGNASYEQYQIEPLEKLKRRFEL